MIVVREPLPNDLETIGKDAAEEWVRDYTRVSLNEAPIIADVWTRVATINGRPVAAGGFKDRGHDMAIGWALVGAVPETESVGICRAFRQEMRATPFKWIEAHCIATFYQSHRWLKCLGFEPAHGERCFTPDGREFRKFVFRNGTHE